MEEFIGDNLYIYICACVCVGGIVRCTHVVSSLKPDVQLLFLITYLRVEDQPIHEDDPLQYSKARESG